MNIFHAPSRRILFWAILIQVATGCAASPPVHSAPSATQLGTQAHPIEHRAAPQHSDYRVVRASGRELWLERIGPTDDVPGRLWVVSSSAVDDSSTRIRAVLEEGSGTRYFEANAAGGVIWGQVSVGDGRWKRWRVRVDSKGRLSGERWPLRASGVAPSSYLYPLSSGPGPVAGGSCRLAETLALAQLAVEVGTLALEGGRANTSLSRVRVMEGCR